MKERYTVEGMVCTACSSSLERALKKVDGIESANVNLIAKSLNVEYDESLVNSKDILLTIKKCGFSGSIDDIEKNKKMVKEVKQEKEWTKGPSPKVRLIVSFSLLIPLMYVSMGHMINLPLPHFMSMDENPLIYALVELILTTPILIVNRKFFINGARGLIHLSPNMDTLISLGSFISYLYGIIAIFFIIYGDTEIKMKYVSNLYFDASAMILSLITIGKTLEEKAKTKTISAVEALKELRPDKVRIIVDDKEIEIDINDLKVGDILSIKAGEAIPADGLIVSGSAYIDESAITGESIPKEKTIGDNVVSATINTDGYLHVKALAVNEDTTLSKIINLVKDASGSKMNMQLIADRISVFFVPSIILISLITFITWLLIKREIEPALFHAIQVLVISCPCALGLATPVAVTASIGACAKKGILIKDSLVFETLNKVDTVIFDKTGTLTTGKIYVSDVYATNSKNELLEIAKAIEAKSSHPIASAILEYTKEFKELDVTDYKILPGMGVECRINSDIIFGGNKRLFDSKGVVITDQNNNFDGTVVYFGRNKNYHGSIYLRDKVRDSAKDIVTSLKEKGIFVSLLSGDSYNACNKVISMLHTIAFTQMIKKE